MPGPSYLPGRDTPRINNAVQGRFFSDFPAATPKFALNQGPRRSEFLETMARLIIDVSPTQRDALLTSLPGDTRAAARTLLSSASLSALSNGTSQSGFFDFMLTNVQQQQQEREFIVDTLSDVSVVYYLGQSAPQLSCSGYLLNTVQDDQNVWFQLLYNDLLRGTQLARRGLVARLRYDSFFMTGYLANLVVSTQGGTLNAVQFSYTFRVKQIQIATPILYNPSRGTSLFAANVFTQDTTTAGDDSARQGVETALTPVAPSAVPAAEAVASEVDARAETAATPTEQSTAASRRIASESLAIVGALTDEAREAIELQARAASETPLMSAAESDPAGSNVLSYDQAVQTTRAYVEALQLGEAARVALERTTPRGAATVNPVDTAPTTASAVPAQLSRAQAAQAPSPAPVRPANTDPNGSRRTEDLYQVPPELVIELDALEVTLPQRRGRTRGRNGG